MLLFCNGFFFRSICRYDLHRRATELQRLKDYVEKKALIEGTEMEKVVEVEVANVSNVMK